MLSPSNVLHTWVLASGSLTVLPWTHTQHPCRWAGLGTGARRAEQLLTALRGVMLTAGAVSSVAGVGERKQGGRLHLGLPSESWGGDPCEVALVNTWVGLGFVRCAKGPGVPSEDGALRASVGSLEVEEKAPLQGLREEPGDVGPPGRWVGRACDRARGGERLLV